MPRKKEPAPPPPVDGEIPVKFTSFLSIGYLNGKNVSANYSRTDQQTWINRRAQEEEVEKLREGKRRRLAGVTDEQADEGAGNYNVLQAGPSETPGDALMDVEGEAPNAAGDSFSKTIVIHPGSRWLRIGRASDFAPTTVPNTIARKRRATASHAANGNGTATSNGTSHATRGAGASTSAAATAEDPAAEEVLAAKIQSLRGDLKARLRIYNLRGQGNGNSLALAFNQASVPEPVEDDGDVIGLQPINWTEPQGEEVFVGREAADIYEPEKQGYELRWPYLKGHFNTAGYHSAQELLGDVEAIIVKTIQDKLSIPRTALKTHSAILIVPDMYDDVYLEEMAHLLLNTIGFRQISIQQESVCATFGAGISNAVVVDIGAKVTSVCCVEEGFVLPETRTRLNFGGDDVTQLLLTLLNRLSFPYKECDLATWRDYEMMDGLKEKMVVLSEGDITQTAYDFYRRAPGVPTKKYVSRVYDDAILAAYTLFSPRIVDFDKKNAPTPQLWSSDVESNTDLSGNPVTNAMKNTVRHLFAAPPPTASLAPPGVTEAAALERSISASPNPAAELKREPEDSAMQLGTRDNTPVDGPPAGGAGKAGAGGGATRQTSPAAQAAVSDAEIRLESSKIPLDVAVVESILAAGAEERQKRLAQQILIVGGSGLLYNVGFAIESRIVPVLATRAPYLTGSIGTFPIPKELDPRTLAWKGICPLAKLDVAAEHWIRREEAETLGLRKTIRERALFLM